METKPTTSELLYEEAVKLLGEDIYALMTPSVPPEDGCAASVSYVASKVVSTMPMGGMLTVNTLIGWCLANGTEKPVNEASVGNILTAHMPDVKDPQWAHTVIQAKSGCMGNTSFPIAGFKAGEWAENYQGNDFITSFTKQGCVIRCFELS